MPPISLRDVIELSPSPGRRVLLFQIEQPQERQVSLGLLFGALLVLAGLIGGAC